MFELAQKVIDTDIAACANAALKRYRWQVKPFFLWGSWDSLIFILSTLCKSDLLSAEETEAAWGKVKAGRTANSCANS